MSLQLRAEDIRSFIGNSGDFQRLPIRAAVGQAGLEWARVGSWRVRATGGYVFWRTAERESRSTPGLFVSARTEPGLVTDLRGEAVLTRDYRYALAEAAALLRLRRLSLEPGIRIGAGRNLPVQETFEFGGVDGFPGLAIAERRGDREVVARIQSAFLVQHPLSLRFAGCGWPFCDGWWPPRTNPLAWRGASGTVRDDSDRPHGVRVWLCKQREEGGVCPSRPVVLNYNSVNSQQ